MSVFEYVKALRRLICLVLYYSFAIFLPETNNRYLRRIRFIRRMFASPLFDKCGKKVIVEKGANFGTGKSIEIGDFSMIGLKAYIRGPLKIGRDVLMGPECVILTTNHNFSKRESPIRLQGSTSKTCLNRRRCLDRSASYDNAWSEHWQWSHYRSWGCSYQRCTTLYYRWRSSRKSY